MGKGKRYAFKGMDSGKIFSKASGANMSAHFKNTVETANAIRGLTVDRAIKYLNNVMEHKECVPFRIFKGGVGKCAQAKQFKTKQGRWPSKSCKLLLDLIKNAVSNAEFLGMDVDQLIIVSIQVNQGPSRHRRTYRAHGVINPYMSHSCHVDVILGAEEKV